MSEVSRIFDPESGAVHAVLRDSLGRASHHTVYVAGVEDVDAELAKRGEETEAQAQVIRERMTKAGWVDPSSAG